MTFEEIEALASRVGDGDEAAAEQALGIIQGRDSLEWAMGILAEGEAEKSRIAAEVERARARLVARERELLSKVDRSTAFLRGCVEGYARAHRKDLIGGRGKTANLVHGSIAYRASAERLVVEDEDVALSWCQRQPPELGLVRTTYEIAKKPLAVHFAATGEIPPGCAVRPAEETITIHPDSPEALDVSPERKALP